MKLRIAIINFIALFAIGLSAPGSADAGKKLKNLKVLSPKLGKKLGKGMKQFTKGLGVKCIACHVKGKMEKDDVPTKGHSRTFIKAVLKSPDQRKAALAKLLKELKLEKAKNEAKIWKAFDIWESK